MVLARRLGGLATIFLFLLLLLILLIMIIIVVTIIIMIMIVIDGVGEVLCKDLLHSAFPPHFVELQCSQPNPKLVMFKYHWDFMKLTYQFGEAALEMPMQRGLTGKRLKYPAAGRPNK